MHPAVELGDTALILSYPIYKYDDGNNVINTYSSYLLLVLVVSHLPLPPHCHIGPTCQPSC